MTRAPLYVGLVHFPVISKDQKIIASSVTNLDLHDISRTCLTFGANCFFVITPVKAQHSLVRKIIRHWESDEGNAYNPDRANALREVVLVDSLEDAVEKILQTSTRRPKIVVTGANFVQADGATEELRSMMEIDNTPILLVFGTGWGLAPEIVELADFRLFPIRAPFCEYNHLSVRSAVAIYLDRLLGERVSGNGEVP